MKIIPDNHIYKLLQHNPLLTYTIHVNPKVSDFDSSVHQQEVRVTHPKLTQLLFEHQFLFKEPKSLPPHRLHDHKIPLLKGTGPMNIRPYKHSPL